VRCHGETPLRQSFLNGSLTRLLDPDATLRGKIVEFVARGEFSLASGQKPDGTYERIWYGELIAPDEVTFEANVFLLTKPKAQALKAGALPGAPPTPTSLPTAAPAPRTEPTAQPPTTPGIQTRTFVPKGTVPPEVWNRPGTKILPKLRAGRDMQVGIEFSVTVESDMAKQFESDIRHILEDLGLAGKVRIED